MIKIPHLQPEYARSRHNSVLLMAKKNDKAIVTNTGCEDSCPNDLNYTVNTYFTTELQEDKDDVAKLKLKENVSKSAGTNVTTNNGDVSRPITRKKSSLSPPIYDPSDSKLEGQVEKIETLFVRVI